MRQVTGLTSTYSSDEFGICSALFELGGMVVMHDASGCNSTYTTHDEPRWYDMDSMIFISAISEMEAIMGDDDKFIGDLVETAENLQPKFIALVGAPIPYMIGTDLDAIAREVEQKTGIPSFAFPANGMHDYTVGVSMALEKIVEIFAVEGRKDNESSDKRITVNIIGATPLDFSLNGSVESIEQWIKYHGMEMNVCLSMGCTLEDVKRLGNADVNLVVSAGGLAAAKLLERRFGMPYLVGVPIGEKFSEYLAEQLKQINESSISYRDISAENASIAIIGEAVYSASLAAALKMDRGLEAAVLCPMDIGRELLREGDEYAPEEDDLMERLTAFETVIADPLYKSLIRGQDFHSLPHEAFSGRIYDKVNPNLIGSTL